MALPYTLQDTIISLTINAGLHVIEYSALAFDYALSGPFNKPFNTPIPASEALCKFVSYFYLRLNGLILNYNYNIT